MLKSLFKLILLTLCCLEVSISSPIPETIQSITKAHEEQLADKDTANFMLDELGEVGSGRPLWKIEAGKLIRYTMQEGRLRTLQDVEDKKAAEYFDQYGTFSSEVAELVKQRKYSALDVLITIKPSFFPIEKITDKSIIESFETVLSEKAVEVIGDDIEYLGSGIFRSMVPIQKLLSLKRNNSILRISLAPDESKSITIGQMDRTFGSSSYGMDLQAICPSSCGGYNLNGDEDIYVGYVDSYIVPAQLNGILDPQAPWFTYVTRSSPPPSNDHVLNTVPFIRNNYSPQASHPWSRGGAYNAKNILLITSDHGSSEIHTFLSGSFFPRRDIEGFSASPPHWHANSNASAHAWEYYLDVRAATYPYSLAFLSAGNAGQQNQGQNQQCQDEPSTSWSASDCQRVAFWNHNSVIVGNMQQDLHLRTTSSWRNGPAGNEAPHLVTQASYVERPWGTPTGGTTVASALMTAFATSLASGSDNLHYYPEATKAVIMASCVHNPKSLIDGGTRWRSNNSQDLMGGFGFPNGYAAKAMSQNRYFADGQVNQDGFMTFSFTGANQTLVNYLTINPSSSGNYHLVATWMGDPTGKTPTQPYSPDDIDMTVEKLYPTTETRVAATTSTTEYLTFAQGSGYGVYKVTLSVQAKRLNGTIYGALAWTYTN